MLRVSSGSHIVTILGLIGIVGEIPQQSLYLLGSVQTVKRVVSKMLEEQEYENAITKERITCKAISKNGEGSKKTLRITAKGKILLGWIGLLKNYEDITYSTNLSFEDTHVLRNHKLAEVVMMLHRAGVTVDPNLIRPLRPFSMQANENLIQYPSFYSSKTLKNVNESESVKLKYILTLGAVMTKNRCYSVYNTRNDPMRWNGEGEGKASYLIGSIASHNSALKWNTSCIMFANNGQVVLDSIKQSRVKRSVKGTNGRWYKEAPVSIIDMYYGVHFVPLDENGIRLLRILFREDCREKITEIFFSKEEMKHNYNNFDAIKDGKLFFNHLDSDMEKLVRLYDYMTFHKLTGNILCYDFQLSYLQAYFGNKASYYVCKLDVIEERLGLPKWQNTKR